MKKRIFKDGLLNGLTYLFSSFGVLILILIFVFIFSMIVLVITTNIPLVL